MRKERHRRDPPRDDAKPKDIPLPHRPADRPYLVEDEESELVDELEMRRRTNFAQR